MYDQIINELSKLSLFGFSYNAFLSLMKHMDYCQFFAFVFAKIARIVFYYDIFLNGENVYLAAVHKEQLGFVRICTTSL